VGSVGAFIDVTGGAMKQIVARILTTLAFGLLCSGFGSSVACSQSAIKFVIPVPPGGPLDLLARVLADQISQKHGVKIVVENRAGGANVVAVQAVAHAAPDGNTVLIHSPAFLITPQLQTNEYDPFKLFDPVCTLVNSPVVIAVNADSPYRTLADLIDAARAKPGELTLASVGPATPIHLGVEMLKRAAHVDMTYVPFKGDGPGVTALLGGHVTAMLANFASVSEHISAGKLRALAVGSKTRLAALPDVPTVAEAGYKNYEVGVWFGAVVPAGTPNEKIGQLGEWFTEALQTPAVKAKLAAQQLDSVPTCGARYSAFLHTQYEAFGAVIRDAHITTE
jgi:tripartite-type tricarboxylate transporter receptor subunit TctC